MAKPCKVTIKTSKSATPKEMTFEDYMEMLYSGELETLISDGTIKVNKLSGDNPFGAKLPEPTETQGKRIVPKTLLNKAYEAATELELAKAIARYGLDREVENRLGAKEAAQKFIEKVGPEEALKAVRNNKVDGGAAAYIYAEVLDMVYTEMEQAQTEEDIKQYAELHAKLLEEVGRKQLGGGRFNSAFADIYNSYNFAYTYEKKVQEYKDRNGGFIPEEVDKKFKELDEKIKDLNRKIKDAEARVKLAEESQTIEAIIENTKRKEETEANVKYTKKAKEIADKFRKLKSKPIEFKDANGNTIRIKTQGITWNDLVEIGAKAIEASGKVADGISAMIDRLSEEDWYNNLNDTDKAAVNAQVEAAFSDNTDGKISIPKALIESLVTGGIDNINDLTAAVMAQMKSKYPNATEREFRDAITGYGKEVSKTSNEIREEIARIKNLGRMMSKLEDLTAGIARQTNPEKRAKMSQQEKELKRKINDMMEDLGINQSNRLDRAKENANKRIEELQRRLDEGDFTKKKNIQTVADEELTKLRMEKQDLQEKFDTEMYKLDLKNRKTIQKIGDVLLEFWNLPRALMATGEISFMLIQGGIQSFAHPINAYKAAKNAWSHFKSESKAKQWMDFERQQPYFEEMKKSKLSFTQQDTKLNAREEAFLGGWVNYLWDYAGWPMSFASKKAYEIWKRANIFKALERATSGYMNTIRVLRYQEGSEKLRLEGKNFNDNPQDYKNMADVINTLTGRASLGPLEGMSKPLSLIFFSPRNWASVIKTTTPFAFYHFGKMGKDGTLEPSVAQKMAMADFMKYVGITAGFVAMAAARFNEDDDDETEVVMDPTSSDFGKIILGNTRIDPWGGRIQMIIYQSRFMLNAFTKDGVTQPLGSGPLVPNRFELTGKLFENKLAPAAALATKWLKTRIGKNGEQKLYGKEFLMSEELQGTLYPMYWGTLNELWKDQPETVAGFLSAYAFLGGGVSTYESGKGSIKYDDPATKQMMRQFKPDGVSKIKEDTFNVTLTEEELETLNSEYTKKANTLLDLYSKTNPSFENKDMFPPSFDKVTDNQLEEARAEAIKIGFPEYDLDKESKRIAIEKKKTQKISDDISELTKLAKDAAAYEYFKSLGKRIPPTIEEAVKDYEKKLKKLNK
jgi:hypothetical protein